MIAADLTQTPERSEVLEFTTPFMTNPLTLLLKVTFAENCGSNTLEQISRTCV